MKKNSFILGGFLIIIAAVMWGIDGVLLTPSYFSKFHFYDVNFIVFIAHAIPSFILSILFTKQYKMLKKFTKNDFIFFSLIALFGGSIGTLSIVKALQLSEFNKFSIVILIQKTQPVFAVFLAFLILKERPSRRFYLIALISLISVYLLTFEFKSPILLPKNNILAAMYSLLAAFSFGSSTVFGKKIVSKFSFLTSTFFRFFFTTIITMFFLLFSGNTEKSLLMFSGNPSLMALSLFIAIFGLSAILIYYNGLKHVTASVSTVCELAFPLTSVIVEAVVLKRFLSPIQFVSAGILIGSILYLNLSNVNSEIKEIDKIENAEI
ncbi:DMT family transporter [Leptotrichia sp. OH3620_COT-345]|uniref:DMT family transporter n=1 Tax=Leptotrichia sp. OH3620_COT-345 TaxID=2491048 RepID=UPI000F64B9FC|nr:DMT family transporter [Leptotrichia sp. OH3620_COT-345]RRD39399.1 DMT family transporter [Leptotrichia sp. OH3620_COT-345]